MYRSPFELVMKDFGVKAAECMDELVFKAAYDVGVRVDKAELISALRHDRGQYDKGFADGKAAAMDELVRCKDCKHFAGCEEVEGVSWTGFCKYGDFHTDEEDFCSRGERRSE